MPLPWLQRPAGDAPAMGALNLGENWGFLVPGAAVSHGGEASCVVFSAGFSDEPCVPPDP